MTLEESQEAVAHFTKEYAALKAHAPSLPSLEEMDGEFDLLEYIGREHLFPRNAIRYCRWAMMQALGSWMGYLHGFVIPNPQNAPSMEEYNFLDDNERQKVIDILNWHMYRTRELNMLQLNEDDKKTAAFIIGVFKEWQKHKIFLQAVLEKTTKAWKERSKGSV